jgi:MFS family permease
MHRQGRSIQMIALATAVSLMGDSMLYIVLPLHYEAAGLDALWQVGLILAFNRLIRLPFGPIVAWAVRKISIRTSLRIACILAVVTTIGYGFANDLTMWLILRGIWGIAWATFRIAGIHAVTALTDVSNRGHWTGIYNSWFRMGSMTGMIGGAVLSELAGIDVTAWILGAMMACTIPLSWRSLPSVRIQQTMDEPVQPSVTFKVWLRTHREMMAVWLSALGFAAVFHGMLTSILSLVVQERMDAPLTIGGWAIGAALVSSILLSIHWLWDPWFLPWIGRISDQYGRAILLCLGFGLAALLLSLVATANALLWFVILLMLVFMCSGTIHTAMEAKVGDLAEHQSGTLVIAGYTMSIDIGSSVGPIMAYALGSSQGMDALFLVMAGLTAFCALYWLSVTVKRKT